MLLVLAVVLIWQVGALGTAIAVLLLLAALTG